MVVINEQFAFTSTILLTSIITQKNTEFGQSENIEVVETWDISGSHILGWPTNEWIAECS